MTDPKQKTLSFPLSLGENRVAAEEYLSPVGEGAALAKAENMRLRSANELPVKQPGTVSIATPVVGSLCGGFAPVGQGESTVEFFSPKDGNVRIADGLTTPLIGELTGAQIAYPAKVSRSYSPAGDVSANIPAVCKYGDLTFSASVRAITANPASPIAIFVSVVDDAGAVIVASRIVYLYTSATVDSIVGITAHSTTGVHIWFHEAGTGQHFMIPIAVSGLTLTVSAAIPLYTPGAPTFRVCTDGSDIAWLATFTTGSTATTTVLRINTVGPIVIAVAPGAFNGLTASASFAIAATEISGTQVVALAVSRVVPTTTYGILNATTLATSWSNAGPALFGTVSAAFSVDGSGDRALFGVSVISGAFSAGSNTETRLQWRARVGGALVSEVAFPWHTVLGMATYKRSNTEIYPILLSQHRYSTTLDPTSVNFEFDPSVEVYMAVFTRIFCVARLGVDVARRIMAQGINPVWAGGSTAIVGYLEDENDVTNRFKARITELDFTSRQPSFSVTAQGPSVVASAMPYHWDGMELTEPTPLHQPACRAVAAGGTGPALAAGNYSFRAVYKWKDAAGQVHRSAASTISNVIAGGAAAIVHVTVPVSFRDGSVANQTFEIDVYATLAGGSIYYLQAYTQTAISAYTWTFSNITQPLTGIRNPVLYSSGAPGQELPPLCPPAFAHVALVNSRMWGIDAERPWRAWPSKQKQEGISFEWHPDLIVAFPAAAGKLLAVAPSGGYPLFFAERGVWAVAGQGPNNTGLPPNAFSDPMQVSSLPCTSAASVVETPAGVMFKSGDRFAVASTGGAQVLPGADSDGTIVHAYVDQAHQEVVWLYSEGYARVYSYAIGTWRTWTTPPNVDAACLVPTTQDVLFTDTTRTTFVMDLAGVSTTAQGLWQTGWVLLGGDPQADCQIQEFMLQAKRFGAHGVTVTVARDYDDSTAQSFTYSAADITALCDTHDRYTLCMSPKSLSCRAVKVLIQETGATGTAMQPLFCSLIYGQLPGTLRAAVLRQGRK